MASVVVTPTGISHAGVAAALWEQKRLDSKNEREGNLGRERLVPGMTKSTGMTSTRPNPSTEVGAE